MTKHSIEICIISARGLGRPTSLLKPHWFAVGWIDPNNKYCTKIHTSGGANPTWQTIFPFSVDDECCNLEELAFTVQVHKRDPVFLRESLHGSATVMLKEFLAKFSRGGGGSRPVFEETGSFQLRKAKSEKPTGFVDISVRISLETVIVTSRTGNNKAYTAMDQGNGIALAIEDGPVLSYPAHFRTETQPQYEDKFDNSHPHHYGITHLSFPMENPTDNHRHRQSPYIQKVM
ncbi:hypothetical protein HPP92_019043 [Vanilla planifolia]|uniref:C2 domain-containing protein n=1 Tax=Vanilla planifolia TaxID=51239 RepID=A0A835QER9_VANPL|nr:hypothetical protein HPP92_019043 [Vanilla planifolia]